MMINWMNVKLYLIYLIKIKIVKFKKKIRRYNKNFRNISFKKWFRKNKWNFKIRFNSYDEFLQIFKEIYSKKESEDDLINQFKQLD